MAKFFVEFFLTVGLILFLMVFKTATLALVTGIVGGSKSLIDAPCCIGYSCYEQYGSDDILYHTGLSGEFAQQYLVDDLYASSLVNNVLAYIIYIIKEIAEGVEQWVGFSGVFYDVRVGNDIDTHALYVDVDVCASHNRVT